MINRMGFGIFTKLPVLSSFLIFLLILKECPAKNVTVSPSSLYAVANQDFILTCTTTYVPIAVLWKRNGADVFYMQLDSNICRISDAGGGLSSNYRYNCTDNKTYNLIIPADRIQREEGSKWQCKDSGGNYSSSVFTLRVARPPTSDPVVTGYNNTILYPGNSLKLTCTVQGGTPLATLSWTCKGSSVTGSDKSTTTTAISEVTVNIDSSYNGQKCVCKAEHLTWTTNKTAENQQLVVYYPPSSDPVVSGYDGSELYVNKSIVLSCLVTGGNPLATLSWTCDGQNYPGTNRSVVNTAINELSITATSNLNGKYCICKGRHPVTSYSKDINSATFLVYYAPSESPVLTGYVSGQPIYKGNKQLECKVTGSSPLSILTMTCNNIVISGTNQSTSTESRFIYSINVDKAYNKQQCICNGRHPDRNIGYNRNTAVTFNVYFAPDTSPVISGYTNNQIIYEPENKNLTCRVNGGNPVATLAWACRGLNVSSTNQSVEREARSTITLDINRDYNNNQCVCRATHLADNYNRQTNVTFTVYFPPSSPVVTNKTSFPWLEGRRGSLLCSSSPGYPPLSYRWRANGALVTEEKSQMINFTGLTKEFNMMNYSCEVYNNYTTQKGQHLWSPNIQLNVEYSPVISVGNTSANITEGKNFTRSCTAQGNPEPSIEWINDNQNSEVLQFINSNRNQTGNYTCEAIGRSSTHGDLKSQKDLTVIVQYPPTVTILLSSSINGQTSNIVCAAKGVPDNYHYTSWTQMYSGVVIRKGLNFGSLSSDNSRLTLTDVSYQDIGIYTCTVHNTIKDRNGVLEQQGSAYLNISFPAAFMQNSQRKFYAELGHKVDIEIPFFSNPSLDNGSITIFKSDKIDIDLENMEFSLQVKKTSLNLTFHGTNIRINGQKSIFVIHSFKEEHKGNYTMNLTTSNGLTSSYIFEIIPSGPPGQPYKLLILGNTTTSITVGWSSDFNGGYPQTFVIVYTPVNNKDKPKEIRVKEIEQKRNYNYTLNNLNPGTEYLILIYSFNRKGNSTQVYDSIEKLSSKTQAKKDDDSNLVTVIAIVSAFAVVLVIVLSIVAGIFFFRRRGAKGTDRRLINGASSGRSVDDTDSEDGMRDNVLYEPAGPNFVPKTKQKKACAVGGKNGDIYSEVRKPGKKQDEGASSDVYAVVRKKPKFTQGSAANSSDIYSEVKKTKKCSEGTLYENMETSFNKQGSNTDKKSGPSSGIKPNTEKPQKPPKPAKQKRNEDGLIYVDLILDEPTMDGKQFVIHGKEDKTDYAVVDFSRKADPLPPETGDNVKEAAQ